MMQQPKMEMGELGLGNKTWYFGYVGKYDDNFWSNQLNWCQIFNNQ